MPATQKDPVLVTVQLSGGNDYLNTVIPFNDPLYRDNRPAVGLRETWPVPTNACTARVTSEER